MEPELADSRTKSVFELDKEKSEADQIKERIAKQFEKYPEEVKAAARIEAMRLLSQAKEFEVAQQKATSEALEWASKGSDWNEAASAATASDFFGRQAGYLRHSISELGGGSSQPHNEESYKFLVKSLLAQAGTKTK